MKHRKTPLPITASLVATCLVLAGCDSRHQPTSHPSPHKPPQSQEPPPVSVSPEVTTRIAQPPSSLATTSQITAQRQQVAAQPHRLLVPPSASLEQCTFIPFYQALPFARGELMPGAAGHARAGDESLSAVLKPLAYWSDGSIRWLGIDGLISRDFLASHSAAAAEGEDVFHTAIPLNIVKGAASHLPRAESQDNYTPPKPRIDLVSGAIHWESLTRGRMFTFTPTASVVKVTLPKAKQDQDPTFLDTQGQFAWAEKLEQLTSAPQIIPLIPKLVKYESEEETALYTTYRFLGHGGEKAPGKQLEWMLRAKVYKNYPLIRLSMTWMPRWKADEYALASAKWNIRTPHAWSEAIPLGGDTPPAAKLLQITSREDGSHTLTRDAGSREIEKPTIDHDGFFLSASPILMSVAVPDFTKSGPGHLRVEGNLIELASWSDHSGKALDLRRSGQPDEFGISGVDLSSTGSGLSHTLEASLILGSSPQENRALARYEAARDSLWFTSAADIERTKALGPFNLDVLANHPDAVRALYANTLFLIRARENWKWYGFATYGDYRTNFALGDDRKRGLHAGHWVLHGRYGWRNASASINYALIRSGLALNDRELLLAGILNARHIADVDTKHPSFFSPAKGDEGGMHRRNRDHWSGSVQVQYSPTKGLYHAKWLSNDPRLEDALAETRDYVVRDGGETSCFAAQAWIMRYSETHSAADYDKARSLLEKNAAWWKAQAKPEALEGYSALYAGNFRRISDGMETLIQFHEATDDKRYLDAIKASALVHGLPDSFNGKPDVPYILAYLLANGVTEDDLGGSLINGTRALMEQMQPGALPDPRHCGYKELTEMITMQLPPKGSPAYRESASIAARATYGFLALEYFGPKAPQSGDRHVTSSSAPKQ